MDIFERIQGWLLAVRARVRNIEHSLEDHAKSDHIADEVERGEASPQEPIRVTVSFEEETTRRAKADGDRQYKVQNSIRRATWFAFGAATVYALISLLQWSQMLKQSRLASATLKQSSESFKIDERAWVEIESVKPITAFARSDKFGAAFRYGMYLRNFGKTAATDIHVRAARNMQGAIGLGSDASQMSSIQEKLLFGQFGNSSDIPMNQPIPRVLAPQITSPVPFVMDGQEPQVFSKAEWVSYLIGRADYVDAFGVKHWLKFCYFVVNAKGDLWSCQEGNDEDHNPEMPLK